MNKFFITEVINVEISELDQSVPKCPRKLSVDSPYDTLNQTSHNHIQSLLLKFWNGIRWLCLVVFAGLRNRAFILRRFILFYFFNYQCLKKCNLYYWKLLFLLLEDIEDHFSKCPQKCWNLDCIIVVIWLYYNCFTVCQ